MKRLATALLVGLLAGILAPARADAIQLELSFSGTISDVPAALDGLFAPLDEVSGSFVFDTATPDTNPSAEFGEYVSTPSDAAFHFGSFTWTAPGGGGGDATLVRNQLGQDSLSVNVLSPTGPTTNGYTASNLGFQIADGDGTAFSSDAFPLALDAGDFSAATATIGFQKTGFPSQMIAAAVTFTVPEAGAMGGLSIAVVALAALHRARGGLGTR